MGDEVNMSRTVEVALIPVFQFGVFSDSDLGFFEQPQSRLRRPCPHQRRFVSGRGRW